MPLTIVCAVALYAFFSAVQSDNVEFRWSMATGYVALVLLAATLIVGAFNVIRSRRIPVSSDLRRDIGIWCGAISLAHVIIGLQVHLGNMLLYFFREAGAAKRLVPRTDLFGFANYAGLVAAIIVLLLLITSNDISLRRLGSKRWKAVQRWNYAFAFLVVLHSIAYQVLENRQPFYVALFSVVVLSAFVFQVKGFRRKRGQPVSAS
ncbi:MAG: ferric reductase-like transmembrane domain-containing protein [Acidobacteriota bacterium]|nr:ferric reductase-like transmembrane domain-containing protein [Acidobacteriota bacterium]